MNTFNLNNKKFHLVQNSSSGQVDQRTEFHFKQEDDLVSAEYFGGSIQLGKILATFRKNDLLDMRYHCITTDDEFKCGKALAKVSLNEQGKICLDLDWEWIGDEQTQGRSAYVEL